jgi:hypothetical protein
MARLKINNTTLDVVGTTKSKNNSRNVSDTIGELKSSCDNLKYPILVTITYKDGEKLLLT